MKSLLSKQAYLQKIFERQKVISLAPQRFAGMPKAYTLDYISQMLFFLHEEGIELMEEMAGSRDSLKPWHDSHKGMLKEIYQPSDKIRSEAIDMLCFCMNICLAAGLTHENIEEEYHRVYNKIRSRQNKYETAQT